MYKKKATKTKKKVEKKFISFDTSSTVKCVWMILYGDTFAYTYIYNMYCS